MTVRGAIDEALVVMNQTQEVVTTTPNGPKKGLWASCVEYFEETVFRLNMTIDRTIESTPLDVQTWLSACIAYLQVCQKGFELRNITNTKLPIITTNLTNLISNSLAISVLIRGNESFPGWTYSDEGQLSGLVVDRPDDVVAQDGSGNFTTVREAIYVSLKRVHPGRFVIYVKAGIYTENVLVSRKMKNVMIYGDGADKTIITGRLHAPAELKDTATFQVWGDNFIALDITFRNTAGPQGGQAVALLSGGHNTTYYRCSFEGYQDTLFTIANKQFYKECQIYGTVDFIFGDALVVFQDCGIFFRKPVLGGGLVVAAQGQHKHNESTGYSLQGCKIMAAPDLKPVIRHYNKAFLGRPWFGRARMVYMQSFLDDLIDPEGWLDSWGYNKTAYCAEYKNYGPGSSTDQRVKWAGVIKVAKIAELFTVAKFIDGKKWLPQTGVPFIPGLENRRGL